jgi:hypothetical protein
MDHQMTLTLRLYAMSNTLQGGYYIFSRNILLLDVKTRPEMFDFDKLRATELY